MKGTCQSKPPQGVSQSAIAVGVYDTGIGIEKEDLGRIFAPFEQAENTVTGRSEGTGLGLPLTRRLVELQVRQTAPYHRR